VADDDWGAEPHSTSPQTLGFMAPSAACDATVARLVTGALANGARCLIELEDGKGLQVRAKPVCLRDECACNANVVSGLGGAECGGGGLGGEAARAEGT
jgi:hypothetical protein